MIRNKIPNYWNTIDDAELIDTLDSWTAILVKKETADYTPCLLWCLKHSSGRFIDRTWDNNRLWYFENDQDALMFAIQFGD